MYLITILMPVYNAEKYLERTINSVINQTIGFENIELILVDDNSSDSSKNIIQDYANKYSNILAFFSDKNHGYPGYGRNVGLANATAEYIMFIDNDDEYEPDFCEKVYNIITKEECDVVSTNFRIIRDSFTIDENVFSRLDSDCEKSGMKLIKLNEFRNVTDAVIWTKIFKKSIIQENNLLFVEDRLSEDKLFLINYYYYANNSILIDYYGYNHYQHGKNLSYISSKSTLGFLNSYYDVLNLIEEKYGKLDKSELFRDNIELTLYSIMLSSHKKCLLEKLYQFEKDIQFNGKLNHFWATLCNYFLLKRKFNIVLFLLVILRKIKIGIDFLRKIKS